MSSDQPAAPREIDVRILGLLDVRVDGRSVEIATRRQRALLVLLLLNVGRVVSAERLIDQLWDGAPPPQGAVTLRSYVSNLRQALGHHPALATALVTRGSGYLIDVPPDSVDANRLQTLTQTGRDLLRRGEGREALAVLDEAVGLWTGDPLAEVADHEFAQSTLTQLTETYLGAVEGRFEAMLASGLHLDALPGLEAFVADHPLREEPRALLMLALHRSGRTPDALEVHRKFRTLLDEELGIVPSQRIGTLLQRVLAQDPGLDPPLLGAEPAVAPHSPVPAPVTAPRGRPPHRIIVGRERELAVLQAALDRLDTGVGSLVLVAGEPGIGKTTLLDSLEAMAQRRGTAVHVGRAPASAGAPAFWAWSQIVDSVAAALDDEELHAAVAGPARLVAQLSVTVAERTGQSLPPMGESLQALRFMLYESVSTYLARAGAGALVLLLDDIHWADLPSLELLSYLTPSLAARPVLVVAAYRDLPSDRSEGLDATLATVSREDVTHELRLAGLAPGDVAVLTAELLGSARPSEPPTKFGAMLHERTGGNPFFVSQLARLLLDSEEEARPSDTAVPPGVRHVIASRLKPLAPVVSDLLAAGAVIGREFNLRTASAAAGLDAVEALDAFDVAARHGLVEPAGEDLQRFVHALVQEVVLEGIPAGRATHLHAAVARWLVHDGTTSPAVLAGHMWDAREVLGTEGIPSQLAAADAAGTVYAHEQAELHLRRALHLVHHATPPDPDIELSVLLRLFSLVVTARGWGDHDAREVVDRAMQLAEAGAFSDDNARLWWSLFFFLIDRNDQASYVDVADSLLTACQADGPDPRIGSATLAAVHLMNVFSALAVDDREGAREHLLQARVHVDVADPADLAAYDENLHVMQCLIEGYWSGLEGDPTAHRSSIEAAVALADADGRPFPRAVARTLGAATGPFSPHHEYFWALSGEALDIDHRFGFGWLATVAECIHDWSETLAGRADPDAVARLQERLDEMLAGGRNGTHSLMLLLLADVLAESGFRNRARDALLAVRGDPGPYQGLYVDMIDRRLAALG